MGVHGLASDENWCHAPARNLATSASSRHSALVAPPLVRFGAFGARSGAEFRRSHAPVFGALPGDPPVDPLGAPARADPPTVRSRLLAVVGLSSLGSPASRGSTSGPWSARGPAPGASASWLRGRRSAIVQMWTNLMTGHCRRAIMSAATQVDLGGRREMPKSGANGVERFAPTWALPALIWTKIAARIRLPREDRHPQHPISPKSKL